MARQRYNISENHHPNSSERFPYLYTAENNNRGVGSSEDVIQSLGRLHGNDTQDQPYREEGYDPLPEQGNDYDLDLPAESVQKLHQESSEMYDKYPPQAGRYPVDGRAAERLRDAVESRGVNTSRRTEGFDPKAKFLYKFLVNQSHHINLLQKMVKSLAEIAGVKMQVTDSAAYNQNIVGPLQRNKTTSLIGQKAVNPTAFNEGMNAAVGQPDVYDDDFTDDTPTPYERINYAVDESLVNSGEYGEDEGGRRMHDLYDTSMSARAAMSRKRP